MKPFVTYIFGNCNTSIKKMLIGEGIQCWCSVILCENHLYWYTSGCHFNVMVSLKFHHLIFLTWLKFHEPLVNNGMACCYLFVDWLIKRRHCKQNWQEAALVIREKINNAIQDMPAHDDITKLLTGTCKSWIITRTYHLVFFFCIDRLGNEKKT